MLPNKQDFCVYSLILTQAYIAKPQIYHYYFYITLSACLLTVVDFADATCA